MKGYCGREGCRITSEHDHMAAGMQAAMRAAEQMAEEVRGVLRTPGIITSSMRRNDLKLVLARFDRVMGRSDV